MYKLIAIDIDDTLLTDELEVTPGTRAAIEEAVKRGVVVTIATGRMFAAAKAFVQQLKLNVPVITYQGAFVRTLLDPTPLYDRPVPADVRKAIYAYSEANGLHLQAYHNDELFVKEDNDKIRAYSKQSNVPYRVADNFAELMDKPLMKMLIIDEPDKLDEIAADLKRQLGGRAHVTKSKPIYLEFLHPEGTKGHAVRYLADSLGIDMSQVIAIGDSWNDHEMLDAAGLGVAMGNAVESLKSIADFVTLSNNEEGVKHVIEKFVLAP